jgi:hypothetical protein
MNKKVHSLAHAFYMGVYAYISQEYKPKYSRIFADSDFSPKLYDLCNQYYWGGNTVPFTAGQIIDLIQSKFKKDFK